MRFGRAPLSAIGRPLIGSRHRAEVGDENRAANFAAIVLNGLFFPTAGKILGAGLLLTWFVSELTRSAFVVGLLVPIQYGVALLAQPWIAQWMSGRPQRVPFYRQQALVRGCLWGVLAIAVWAWGGDRPGFLLTVFFVVVTLDALAAGVGNIAFSDVLARVIPQSLRGRARGGRGMAGAIVGGTAGVMLAIFVAPESGLGIFAALFAIAGLCYGLGGLTFGLIKESARSASHPEAKRDSLKSRVREMLARAGYRRFLAIQILLLPATQGLVFFSLFGRWEFGLDFKALGLLLMGDAVAPFIGNFFWGRWSDRLGNAWVLASAAIVSLLAPALALTLATVGEHWSHAALMTAFGGIVLALGVASTGVDLASKNFVLDLAPDARRRPIYIGVNDTLIALPTMLLAGAGATIDHVGFRPIFIVCAIGATTAAMMCRSLTKGR
jgi:hypothetical protein